jgi:hypothetical protein
MSQPTPSALALARFLALAKDGRHPAASSGERVAFQLAKTLDAIGDDMALLDSEAIDGFAVLCHLTGGPWKTDDDKARIFETLSRAVR